MSGSTSLLPGNRRLQLSCPRDRKDSVYPAGTLNKYNCTLSKHVNGARHTHVRQATTNEGHKEQRPCDVKNGGQHDEIDTVSDPRAKSHAMWYI